MLRNMIFSLISIFIICAAGCTMPSSGNEKEEEIIGCAPGVENNQNEEGCTINENNDE